LIAQEVTKTKVATEDIQIGHINTPLQTVLNKKVLIHTLPKTELALTIKPILPQLIVDTLTSPSTHLPNYKQLLLNNQLQS